MPIICLVWGDAARNALIELPYKCESLSSGPLPALQGSSLGQGKPSFMPQTGEIIGQNMESFMTSASSDAIAGRIPENSSSSRNDRGKRTLTTFLEVASEYLSQIQLI